MAFIILVPHSEIFLFEFGWLFLIVLDVSLILLIYWFFNSQKKFDEFFEGNEEDWEHLLWFYFVTKTTINLFFSKKQINFNKQDE